MGTPEVKQLGIREAERFEHSPNRGLNDFFRVEELEVSQAPLCQALSKVEGVTAALEEILR